MDQNTAQLPEALACDNEIEKTHEKCDKFKKSLNPKTTLVTPIQLHTSENAWKPYYKVVEQSVEEKEKLRRKVQAVLNKLTFQKLRILLEQLQNLKVVTKEEMNLIVDLVYEHAVYEPRFSMVYANLCKCFDLNVESSDYQSVEEIKFSSQLLTKCQNEFEEGFKKLSKTTINQKTPQQLEEERKNTKAKRIGNIRFIGELYNTNMISNAVLQENIDTLLNHSDELSLECFFWLIKIVGSRLETIDSQGDTNLDGYFEKIQQVINDRTTSSRIRFLLQDVIDLKKNNWVPRRLETFPRTIDEIHQEAALEAYEQFKQCPKKSHNARRSNKIGTNACVCKKRTTLPPRSRKDLFNIEKLESNRELPSGSRDSFPDETKKGQRNKVEDSGV